MKKALALLLALVMCLSLCACGNNENQPTENVSKKNDVPETMAETQPTTALETEAFYNIGDTVVTDAVECTLISVDFQEQYGNCVPKDGQFVVVEFSVKNIAKTDVIVSIGYMPTVDYNNGYTFRLDYITGKDGKNYSDRLFVSGDSTRVLKPLSDEITAIVAINVPSEVVENTDAPLLITMQIPEYNGSNTFVTQPYNFIVR